MLMNRIVLLSDRHSEGFCFCICFLWKPNEGGFFILGYLFASDINVCIVQELCESRGGRPGMSVLTSLLVSVDVKNY